MTSPGRYFIIERILTPDIQVGISSQVGQGIRVDGGSIQRLWSLDRTAKGLKYEFERGMTLSLYKCNEKTPDICYTLKTEEPAPTVSQGVLNRRIVSRFKPISLGDSSKEIDAMGSLFGAVRD